jgi:hypothetical protein
MSLHVRIRLADADRERLGCPEWIDYDQAAVTIQQYADVQTAFGLKPADLWRGLASGDAYAVWAMVWIALRAGGVEVDIKELTFALDGALLQRVDDTVAGPGKDPSTRPTPTPTTSRRSSSGTRSRSRT